jgi:hypothetical protein
LSKIIINYDKRRPDERTLWSLFEI